MSMSMGVYVELSNLGRSDKVKNPVNRFNAIFL